MIHEHDILHYSGAAALKRYGRLTRTVRIPRLGGEELKESHSRGAPNAALGDRGGVLRYAGANIPRISWYDLDADGIYETAVEVLETSRQNGFTQGTDFSQGVWTRTNLSNITTGATTGPDGVAGSAQKLIEDATAGATHGFIRNTPALTDNVRSSWSVFVKAAERTWCRLRSVNKANTISDSYFNTATGLWGTTSANHVLFLERWFSGWYRIGISFSAASGGTTPQVALRMSTADNTQNYNGDGASGLYVYGGDFEVDQTFPTSLKPTIAAVVTRDYDVATAPWAPSPRAMQFYARFVEQGHFFNVGDPRVFQLGDHSANTLARLSLYAPDAGTQYRFRHGNGVTTVDSDLTHTHTYRDRVELLGTFGADGSVRLDKAINLGAVTVGTPSAALAPASIWGDQVISLGGFTATAGMGAIGLEAIIATQGVGYTMADYRALIP